MNDDLSARDAKESGTRIYVRTPEVVSRLHDLGLTPHVLRTAAESAIRSVVGYTDHDPRMAKGLQLWGKMHRGLRDQLKSLGWRAETADGFETTVDSRRKVAVAVARGDDGTGHPGKNPSTRSKKGRMMRLAVTRNQPGFWTIKPSFGAPPTVPAEHTWVLLFNPDKGEEQMRLELALPSGMTDKGHVREWDERIILKPVPYVVTTVEIDDDEEDVDEIDFDVPRMTG